MEKYFSSIEDRYQAAVMGLFFIILAIIIVLFLIWRIYEAWVDLKKWRK